MTSVGEDVKRKEHKFPVIEIFGPTVQGEGALCGTFTHFLRLGGCTYTCKWCDSMHAVDPKQIKANRTMMTATDIYENLCTLRPVHWVTISGGDPCIHKHLHEVINVLKRRFRVAIETQGAIWNDWLRLCDFVTISPKGPSSGMMTDYETLGKYLNELRQCCLKIVIFNDDDLQYAYEIHRNAPQIPMWLQPGTEIDTSSEHKRDDILDRTAMIIAKVARTIDSAEGFTSNVKIIPQMHTLIWPSEDQGR